MFILDEILIRIRLTHQFIIKALPNMMAKDQICISLIWIKMYNVKATYKTSSVYEKLGTKLKT